MVSTSVFSSNGIFWGSEKILVFPLAAPALQKVLRRRFPTITVPIGGEKLTFNPPSIEKVIRDNKGVQ